MSTSILHLSITILTIIACVSLFTALVQQDIRFFEDGAWENDADCIMASRAYVICIFAMMTSLWVSSYRAWRDCLTSSKRSTMDVVYSDCIAIAGTLVFTSWILMLVIPRDDWDFGGEGEKAVFVFGLSCFILSGLYIALNHAAIQSVDASNSGSLYDAEGGGQGYNLFNKGKSWRSGLTQK